MSMLFLMASASISMSILFLQATHPLALGITLLMQTIIVCGATSMLASATWFSYILFLIFLGAMLVLFIYVASLVPNQQFSFSSSNMIVLMTFPIAAVILLLIDPLLTPLMPMIEASFSTSSMDTKYYSFLSPMYSPQYMNLTLFIIVYLLLTLIAAVKIATTHLGALRLS